MSKNQSNYYAVLFSPDGDHVTDFSRTSKEEVWEAIEDMGSRWFFYPIALVAKMRLSTIKTTDDRIVDVPKDFAHLKLKSIKKVKQLLCLKN